ncbi:hypothetical protein L6164_017427 [Bauhinia variegata]|uniref:Uncharacterized protein n=1 Tax=Bauhinia variegata TaxID=167791 RepID=A0ACB9N8H2_BAUVA|nr:hypothetical protein L6164_017427 [Bauhinia variegata]
MKAKGRSCRDHIPPDLYTEILIWLPVKSLIRFTRVSKSWQSLVKDPTFITNHRRNSPTSRKRSLLMKKDLNSVYDHLKVCMSTHYDLDNFNCDYILNMELEIPWMSQKKSIRSVHTCHELVCVVSYDVNIILWNPSIQNFITLPSPNLGGISNRVGFGFDPKAYDYKVVAITRIDDFEFDPQRRYRAEIFSLEAGSWRDIDNTIPCFPVENENEHICVDGVMYWIALNYSARYGVFLGRILAFDLGDEKFRNISLSADLSYEYKSLELAVLKESVCLIQYMNRLGFSDKELCSIWVMEEPGGFVKLITINSGVCLGRALGMRANGEILIVSVDKRLVYSYDPRKSQMSYCASFCNYEYSHRLNTYVESLVLL